MSTSELKTTPVPARGLSRPVAPLVVTKATVVKGLQIAQRYKPNLIGNFVGLGIRVLFFLLIANAVTYGVNGEDLSGRNLFLFFQGAILLLVFNGPTLWAPINAVSTDLYNGTLEYIYSGPGSRYAYYVGTVLTDVIIAMVIFVPFYLFLVYVARAGLKNTLMILVVCAVMLVALTAMGIMIALLALLWRQVGSLAQVLGMLFEFLGGAYLPVSTFPPALRFLAYLLPYTWGYDLIRYYSFDGDWPTLLPVWQEWVIVVAYAILFTLLSRYLLAKSEIRAKQGGLHVI
jgi:ABC-2 type transport system permease protein